MKKIPGRALAALLALSSLSILVGCADVGPIPAPDLRLEPMVLAVGAMSNGDCGGAYVVEADALGSGEGSRVLHGTEWWNSRLGKTPSGCTLYHFIGWYGGAGRAKYAFEDNSPEDKHGKTWPWKPVHLDSPEGLHADDSSLICLDGNQEAGCIEWYFWARYGSVLSLISMSHLDGDAPKIQGKDFQRILEDVDGLIQKVLADS
ncbi:MULTISPECIES: hypothetical protein [Streptomyces]|uniref:Secreted protein n=1 Tax=Streptomyces griseiscabiei TaxID=2993540 RepID=A0ABU4L551_9ACTN|nr:MULTISPECIES: hypothetical protein [Streptomyces]MBZ3901943.1 hypothetical protein [Streptomyces griseiscabiei]MDX2910856.1 hypothetical protein [Streptomyces griseiscabiei]